MKFNCRGDVDRTSERCTIHSLFLVHEQSRERILSPLSLPAVGGISVEYLGCRVKSVESSVMNQDKDLISLILELPLEAQTPPANSHQPPDNGHQPIGTVDEGPF